MEKFKEIESNTCTHVWASGKYRIHQFYYTFNGRSCDSERKIGYWAYHDGVRINGPICYSGYGSWSDVILACNQHYEENYLTK